MHRATVVDAKHICMLPKDPICPDLPPTAGLCRRLHCRLRQLTLICSWHNATKTTIRSNANIFIQRNRQLTSKYWHVIHPFSPLRFWWQAFVLLVHSIMMVYLPIVIYLEEENRYRTFIWMGDLIALMDIFMSFITGYHHVDTRVVVMDPTLIAKNYAKKWFVIDFFGAFPFQFIANEARECFYIFKMLRIFKINKNLPEVFKQLNFTYAQKVVIFTILKVIFFLHWTAYIYLTFLIVVAHVKHATDAEQSRFENDIYYFKNESMINKYTDSIFHIISLCVGARLFILDDEASNDEGNFTWNRPMEEIIISVIIEIAGVLFIISIEISMLRLAIYTRDQVQTFNGKLREMDQCLLEDRVPLYIRYKVFLYINYKFDGHYFHESYILNTLSEQMKQEINLHLCNRLISNVRIFKDMPQNLTNSIISCVKSEIYLPGEVLIKCDTEGHYMFFLAVGTVAIIARNGREVAHLKDGAHFGEAVLLYPGYLRTASVIALEICEVYRLFQKDFETCIGPYPHLKEKFEELAKTRLEETSILEESV